MQDTIQHITEFDYTQPFYLQLEPNVIEEAIHSYTSNKCLHRKSEKIRTIAHDPKLLSIIRKIIGDTFYLWGSSLIVSNPGHKHRYHVDAEHFHIKGATVSIALENCSEDNKFYFMSHSDAIPVSPQELTYKNTEELEKIAQTYNPNAKHIKLHMKPGECVVWKGRTWHSTENRSSIKTPRISLILQYAVSIPKMPTNYDNPNTPTNNILFDGIFIDMTN